MTKGRGAFLIALAFAVFACASSIPVPTTERSAEPEASDRPTPSVSTVPASPTTGVETEHFAGRGVEFDYPATWPVLARDWAGDPTLTITALGTGEWIADCPPVDPELGSCPVNPHDFVALDEGEFAVQLYEFYSGPVIYAFDAPPFDSELLESGLALHVDEYAQTQQVIYFPDRIPIYIDAQLSDPADDSVRMQVDQLIDSLTMSYAPSDVELVTWKPTGQDCQRSEATGRLTRGPAGEISLQDPDYARLTLPRDWTAQVAEDRRFELLDETGGVVAREWDEIKVDGRGNAQGDAFRVCPDGVSVVRSFPSR